MLPRRVPWLPLYFSLTLFLSSALLFAVQPMVAKMVLPLLGGAPAVWNSCMLFFQAALLAGYAYAHLAPAWLGRRAHVVLHLGLLAAALLLLPIDLRHGWTPPAEENPVVALLTLLVSRVALPFVVLAASAPLLQQWFAGTKHHSAGDPYFLYAASNLGSLLALLSYPLLLEPNWTLDEQGLLWGLGFGAVVALTCGCALALCARPDAPAVAPVPGLQEQRPSVGRRLRWLGLAFVPSSLLLSVTTHLTTDIAPIPLLWVLPLGLYLLSFVLVFARRPPVPHRAMVRFMPVVVILLVLALLSEATEPIWLLLGTHLLAFFVIAMACHGELAHDRPAVEHLTAFYFWLALGGVGGGAFNALLAPLLFNGLAEYPLVLVLACLLAPAWDGKGKKERGKGVAHSAAARTWLQRLRTPRGLDFVMPLGLAALTVGLILVRRQTGLPAGPAAVGVMFGVPLLVCYTFIDRPLRFALGVSALLLAALMAPGVHGRVAHQERSYFGVHRVTQDDAGEYRMLVHGNTIHGRQSLDPCRRGEPLSYYHKHGPMGSLFEVFHESHPRGRVAVVGLGAGALAAYGRPGQEFTFYEIDPAVIRIAQKYFTYLDDSRARVRTVAGDARLTLAGAAQGRYDLIVVDAFSSDAIPLHLLTREALRLYLSRLARDGLLAFHISNRYLNLEPVLANLAADAGLVCRVRRDQFVRPPDQKLGAAPSVWVVMARREQDLGRIASSAFWEKVRPRPAEPVWTDDFSNVLSVFSWGGGRDE